MTTKIVKSWFCRTPEGFELFETAAEAARTAQTALDFERGMADDGWSDEVTCICWGQVFQVATACDFKAVCTDDDCDDPDHDHVNVSMDETCDYQLMEPGTEVRR
ncbi:MAG: hypothetical protein HY902_20635 [Deltaproteobacteria bacterium]|nr:hypothetical protein [Deltaproteobacteria bacterium]